VAERFRTLPERAHRHCFSPLLRGHSAAQQAEAFAVGTARERARCQIYCMQRELVTLRSVVAVGAVVRTAVVTDKSLRSF
jgi:hypothetical protein